MNVALIVEERIPLSYGGGPLSIDFSVFLARPPKNLRARWQDALGVVGLNCEFRPDFDPDTWTGTDLVAKMQVAPGSFAGSESYGVKPFVSGCGMDLWRAPAFDEERDDLLARCPRVMRAKLAKATQKFFFYTSMGRSPDGFRLQLFAAATLTVVTQGLFHDPQANAFLSGRDTLKLAADMAGDYEATQAARLKAGNGWKLRIFRDWKSALKDATPEYDGE